MLLKKLFRRNYFERVYEVDLLRGFTALILAFSHVILYLSSNHDNWLYYLSDFISSEPAAPVFMILMGVSIVFSKKKSAFLYFKRGILLLIFGYILNFARSFPYFFMKNSDFFASIPGFFVVDILQFAGLAFLLFALFKKMRIPAYGVFLISIIFLIFGQIFISTSNLLYFPTNVTYFLNLFLPLNNEYCCFNLLTWFIFPCFGLFLGELMSRCENKKRFYSYLFVIGAFGVIYLCLNLGLRFPNFRSYYYSGRFYRMGVENTIITILVDCFLLAFWFFIGKYLPSILKRFLNFLSINITSFYILTWLEISILIHLQAEYGYHFSNSTLIGIVIIVISTCFLFTFIYKKFKRKILKDKIS